MKQELTHRPSLANHTHGQRIPPAPDEADGFEYTMRRNFGRNGWIIAASAILGGIYGLYSSLNHAAGSLSPSSVTISIASGAAIFGCAGSTMTRWIKVWRLIRESLESPIEHARTVCASQNLYRRLPMQHVNQMRSPGSEDEASPVHKFELIIWGKTGPSGNLTSIRRQRVSRRRLEHLVSYLFEKEMLEWSPNQEIAPADLSQVDFRD